MTTLKVNAIEPEGGTTNLTVGLSGQNVVVGGSGGLKANTMKDAGGNTLWTSNGSGVLSSVSGFGGSQVLISSQTASNSASLSFTSGLTSTYKEYIFEFFNINPATDGSYFGFQANATDSTSYDETITSSAFRARQMEDSSSPDLIYESEFDRAQQTILQPIYGHAGDGGDESGAGELHLFNPSNTTYVKHFFARSNHYNNAAQTQDYFVAGYFNTTTAIDDIQFKMSSGNMDGVIKIYGMG